MGAKVEIDNVDWLPIENGLVDRIKENRNHEVSSMSSTIDYYNKNAKAFSDNTRDISFTDIQDRFLSLLPPGSCILDFGCGSGRDTKYFLDKGFQVDAIDGSEELCRLASGYTGIPVKHMYFEDLSEIDKYDGIWACSSILHLPKIKLAAVLPRMAAALKVHGFIYTSFKYGTFEGERNGRYFTDFTLDTFADFIETQIDIKVKDQWITGDVRPGRGEEQWLNIILEK